MKINGHLCMPFVYAFTNLHGRRIKNRLDRSFDAEALCGGYRDVLLNGVFLTPYAVSHGAYMSVSVLRVSVTVCVMGWLQLVGSFKI